MPWIFMCLMAINAVFFGWKFMEGSAPQATVKEKAFPQLGTRIQFLSESSLPRAQAQSQSDQEGEAAPTTGGEGQEAAPVEAPVRQCFNVGPFPNDQEAQSFAASMRSKRFQVRIEKRKVDLKDYWVFIPAFTNRERAEEKLRDLKSNGIQGFVVKEGMFVNAISLNHFSQKDLAQAYLGKMKDAGIQVEFREMTTVGAEPWVFASPARSKDDLRNAVDGYLGSRNGMRREIAACED